MPRADIRVNMGERGAKLSVIARELRRMDSRKVKGIFKDALEGAVSTLPHPVSSSHIKSIAETILRSASEGERDPKVLQTLALLELQISPRR